MSLIFCVLWIHQVTHQFGCCPNNIWHVHLLGVGHHRRVDGSNEEARDLQRASVTHVPVVKLKLRHNCIDSRLFSMWWITSSRFDAHLAPGLTRKVCQTVLFHHDLIGSARISECCRTSKHRLLNVFQHLRTRWHLQLLSYFVTHTSCRQRRNQHPSDKEQTLFLVQLCLAVFRLDLVKKEQCTKVTPVLLLFLRISIISFFKGFLQNVLDLCIVTHPRSGLGLGRWLPKHWFCLQLLRESQFRFHVCQDDRKSWLQELVRSLYIFVSRAWLQNLDEHEVMYTLCMML